MTLTEAMLMGLERIENPQPAYCKGCYTWDPRRHTCADNRDWARCEEEDEAEAERRREERSR